MEQNKDITINDLYYKMQRMENMIFTLMRSKQCDKLNIVEEEVMLRGRLSTKQVIDLVNVSRPTALNYMDKLGKKDNYRYLKGDKDKKRSSIVLFSKSAKLIEQKKIFISLFNDDKKIIPLSQIMKKLGTDLESAKYLVFTIAAETNQYKIIDDNKVEKISY